MPAGAVGGEVAGVAVTAVRTLEDELELGFERRGSFSGSRRQDVVGVGDVEFEPAALGRSEDDGADLLSGGDGDGRLGRGPDTGIDVGRVGWRGLGGVDLR